MGEVQRRSHPTIMSGEVVVFAAGFETQPGILGPIEHALGPFEVSASRDMVMVHRAEIRDPDAFQLFQRALTEAWAAHRQLRTRGMHPLAALNPETAEEV